MPLLLAKDAHRRAEGRIGLRERGVALHGLRGLLPGLWQGYEGPLDRPPRPGQQRGDKRISDDGVNGVHSLSSVLALT